MIYDFAVKDNRGNEVELKNYKGKVLLIVNTATHCGFTPQYQGLQSLYEQYKDRGFEILDFPCNQFGGQAQGSDEAIEEFCSLHYHTTFPRFAKVNVNGAEAEPLFTYLKEEKKGLLDKRIKWNFTKFLVDRRGRVVGRYAPTDKPEKLQKEIEKYLSEDAPR